MMNERKDEQLNTAFEEYFDGSELPAVDLGLAKNELEKTRERRKRGKKIVAALSACASVVLVAALAIAVFPFFMRAGASGDMAGSPDHGETMAPDIPNDSSPAEPAPPNEDADVNGRQYYLSQAATQEISFAEMSGAYSDLSEEFVFAENAENVVCTYRLYSIDGQTVMLGAEMTAMGDNGFTATVYADLSGGTYKALELQEFNRLPEGDGYRISTQMTDGAYVSSVYWVKSAERFATVSSPTESGLQEFLKYFLR